MAWSYLFSKLFKSTSRRLYIWPILIAALFSSFLIALFLGLTSLPSSSRSSQQRLKINLDDTNGVGAAIIVPFRDRFEELLIFAPFIHKYLNEKFIPHQILIVNQVDNYRFNRASLINTGFHYLSLTPPLPPYIIMHDVDLLPLNPFLPYAPPQPNTVLHIASLHPLYNYTTFIGGILSVPSAVFRKVDGMSNQYWGWGLEDDEFYVRLKQNGIKVVKADNLNTSRSDTFKHVHSGKKRKRDHAKCYDQAKKTRKRDRVTGLHNVNYTLQSVFKLAVEGAPLTILNVELKCDRTLSPWCICDEVKSKN